MAQKAVLVLVLDRERGVGDDCTSHLLQGRPGGQCRGALQKTMACSLLDACSARVSPSSCLPAQMKVRDGVCCTAR